MKNKPVESKVAIREKATLETIQLTEQSISSIQHNIKMAEKLVIEVLEKDVDYGIHPGTNSMALRDPGASKINNAFNTYPEHVILYHREDEDMITFYIQARLISRITGEIVAVGMGACSTLESKYGFRWVENPEDYGYKPEELARRRKGKYRIPNPEITDLGHTILLMACKRSESDACKNLPGVGSALAKVFINPLLKQDKRNGRVTDWPAFWGRYTQMGITEAQVHKLLEVASVQNWIDNGGTLDSAIAKIANSLASQSKGAPNTRGTERRAKRDPAAVKQEELRTTTDLQRLAFDCFDMQGNDVWRELGYSSLRDYEENMITIIKDNPAAINNKLWDSFMAIWKSSRP